MREKDMYENNNWDNPNIYFSKLIFVMRIDYS